MLRAPQPSLSDWREVLAGTGSYARGDPPRSVPDTLAQPYARMAAHQRAYNQTQAAALEQRRRGVAPAITPTRTAPVAPLADRMYRGSDADIAELRREQAEFGKVRRQLDTDNSWLAAGALAPVAAVTALEGGALLAGRLLASPLPKAPLSFLEREAWQIRPAAEKVVRSAAKASDDALRRAGRARFAQANGQSASDMGAVVHHSTPVEYARLFPKADPNRLATLWGLAPNAHPIANSGWTTFRTALKGRVPSQAEVMATKLRIDKAVAPYIQRPGVSRPGPRPPTGPVR